MNDSGVRFGVIGLGSMGSAHARSLQQGLVERASLVAVAEEDAARRAAFGAGPAVRRHDSADALLADDGIDAVLIATPHYSHPTLGAAALRAGRHVLVEKPIAVHKADAARLLAAHTDRRLVLAAMFNQRTDPCYVQLRHLIRSGQLGRLQRMNWIITNWFRTNAYYRSGGWRATWAGEGGGVLLNQCPHQLDLWQWLFGMPARVRAFCGLGRYHPIEVEDDVTAVLEYDGGATGVFIATTGEAPGTNRLEVAGDQGKAVLEGDRLVLHRNAVPAAEFCRTSPERFAAPAVTATEYTFTNHGDQHVGILRNFVAAILDGADLLAPAAEGLASVELANAMLLSGLRQTTVALPLEAAEYEAFLRELVRGSS
jgi:predicted dehydrogenase